MEGGWPAGRRKASACSLVPLVFAKLVIAQHLDHPAVADGPGAAAGDHAGQFVAQSDELADLLLDHF